MPSTTRNAGDVALRTQRVHSAASRGPARLSRPSCLRCIKLLIKEEHLDHRCEKDEHTRCDYCVTQRKQCHDVGITSFSLSQR